MQKPLVTIAISFFNNQHTLDDAITSIINQSFSYWELILIDGGSTDKSLSVARQYLYDKRIILVAEEGYKSFVECLNQSVSLASGKYYARMDADDVMHPARLELQVNFLNGHAEVDVVDTSMYAMNQAGELTGERSSPPVNWTLRSILFGQTLNHATVMGRIEWFRSHLYDPLYVRAEDMELWCRTAGCSVFARIYKPLYYVREGRVNIANYRKSQKTSRLIYRKYGREVLHSHEIFFLVFMSYFKELSYTLMGLVGMQGVLTNTRNRKLDLRSLEEGQQMFCVATKRKLL